MAEQQGLRMFSYVAVSDRGTRVEDRMQAIDEASVIAALHRAGYTPLSVEAAKFSRMSLTDLWRLLNKRPPKFKAAQLAEFTKQMHQLLRAGVPIGQAIESLGSQSDRPEIRDMLATVSDRISQGVPLSQAFVGFPKAFDDVFIAYLASAEQSGDLVAITKRLGYILEKRAEIQRRVKGVMAYPVLVSFVIGLILTAVFVFVVPRFASTYSSFGADLPAPTLFVMKVSTFFLPLALTLIGAVTAFIVWNKSQKDNLEVGAKLDRLKFRLPMVGKLFHRLALMRFTSTLGGTLTAGVQTHQAVDLAARSSGSRWLRALAAPMQEAVQAGRPVSTVISEHPDLFPANFRTMLLTGEQTGDVAEMTLLASEAFESDLESVIAALPAKLEVGLLVLMGSSVGSIVIALYLPILQLSAKLATKTGGF